MITLPLPSGHRSARVEYLSGDDVFAVDTVHYAVSGDENAAPAAAIAAEASPYYNRRIPDLSYRIIAEVEAALR